MTNPQFARVLFSLWGDYCQESTNDPHTFENFIEWIDIRHSVPHWEETEDDDNT